MKSSGDDKRRRGVSRRGFLKGTAVGVGIAAADMGLLADAAVGQTNTIVDENALPGTTDDWEIFVFDRDAIEGFATPYSVNAGERVDFKIQTDATNYVVKIYRIGYYGGVGARKVAEITPSATLPQAQPAPFVDDDTGLVDCGNWAVSASWDVPTDAVSGVYIANFELLDGSGRRNRSLFVVRNDGRATDVLVQTSDTTYQAYNFWGESSLYFGWALSGRGTKVSYNRPYLPGEIENDFFYGEIPLVRWLERNGYDVAYIGGVDTARRPAELLNRKVFVSSGHDEYWSGSMRTNVEAARDAGVNLVFMTGNEVFWRVRWEPSPVTSGSHETMVCYKETLQNAKVDPSPEWTGTWRDPRFTPPADGGGNPENGLTGTLFRAINPLEAPDFAIKVPSNYSDLRFWRNTSVATLSPGDTATLTDATLGYEWNTDADNGARPAGLIRLSETTEVAAQVLQDYGGTYTEAPLTHYMTMYKAASGALVWSTGTVQWSWGLDDQHDNRPFVTIPVDVRIQQATLNVLADMGVQPATKQGDLVAASASTDAIPPTSVITGPADGSTAPIGTTVTVTGTASDAGGGVVAGVEVSTDGGTTWHPADGASSWSYSFVPTATGSYPLLSRATDDSCNTEAPSGGRTVQATPRSLPATIWPDTTVPSIASASDTDPLEVGVKFRTTVEGFITGIRFYKGASNTGLHVGRLWTSSGIQLGSVTFTAETPTGWQIARFDNAIAVDAGQTYVASYTAQSGGYAVDPGGLVEGFSLEPLEALASGVDGANGVFGAPGGFPSNSFGSSNYWVDVEFDTDNSAPPAVVERNPSADVSAVDVAGVITARFSEAVQSATPQVTVTGPSGPVAGATAYDPSSKTVSFTPDADLAPLTQYSVEVSGAVDLNDEVMAPDVWSFTSAAAVGQLPSSIWTSSATPEEPGGGDANPIEVGVKFVSDIEGIVTGIRFYQGPANLGPHTGRLWDANGNVLGTADFTAQSGVGWREAPLGSPVTIDKDATYIVSYYAPNGQYSYTPGFFNDTGVDRGPLSAPAKNQVGGNGVFRYGSGGGFPTSSFNGTNYWVDLVMEAAPDVTDPIVVNTIPGPDIIAVGPAAPVTVTFDGAIDSGTVSFTLSQGGTPVPATVSFPDPLTVALTPDSPLAAATTYSASIAAADTSGNVMDTPYQWSFTTATPSGSTPATLFTTALTPDTAAANDPGAIEVGVKFIPAVSGSVTGIRFYRGPGNDGPHVGNLWDPQGNLLGSVTFGAGTAEGWQQADFASPVPVVGGERYTASYHAPAGRYSVTSGGLSSNVERPPLTAPSSATSGGGNGVYSYGASSHPTQSFNATNYFVDVVFVDDSGPSVTATVPTAGAGGIGVDIDLSVAFDEAVAAGTFQAELRDGGGAIVPISVTQDDATGFTISPDSNLNPSTSYTATVLQAEDAEGNGVSAPFSWSFTTSTSAAVSLFGLTEPAVPAANDPAAIELGMRFEVTQAVDAVGIRFYRGPGNVGPHVGHLWMVNGTQLAEVTFAGGGDDGWQRADLATPVPLQPGQAYVVSYFAPSGRYAVNGGYFNGGDVTNGPLVGVGDGGGAANGLFRYGGGFPDGSYNSSNYWVDIEVV